MTRQERFSPGQAGPVFVPGQRWVSEAEPELGLGTVLRADAHEATLVFVASSDVRRYAVSHAPLNRVRYAVGDQVTDGAGLSFAVESIEEVDSLLTYRGEGKVLPEGSLDDQLVFNRPQDRLLSGHSDTLSAFDLRRRTWSHLHRYRSSPLRGLLGGRISLIPHQLYIVESVVDRAFPRVLLSDEIGLGKTIEACLILHRKLMLGRIRRALILVPPALVHQWFIELLRRFSLLPAIFDEERCQSIEQNPESGNPFMEDQLVLCDISWLAGSPERSDQVVAAGWELLIVDEAHHLEWEPGHPSSAYRLVEQLAESTDGVLLLTATPEELGGSGHFARLRLLDPDRYASLEEFESEQSGYAPLVPLANKIEAKQPLSKADVERLRSLKLDPDADAARLVDELIDCYGPGRVVFRNTRRIIKGFPDRHVHLAPLENTPSALLDWIVNWLVEFASEKVLAITHTREAAKSLHEALTQRTGISVGVFHEEMTLLQRDRQAAWFADPDGARLLIASEIGGEGRNFQFAHHLILLDVPENPELLEQRIGRLDRIGQTESIHIHVPYRRGTENEFRALWMHEGLDALSRPLHGAHEIYLHFRDRLSAPPSTPGEAGWGSFIAGAREESRAIARRVTQGRDRLLELHSYRADRARHWVEAIEAVDGDPALETYLLELFESHAVHPEQIDRRLWMLRPDPVFSHHFPGFPRDGMMVTFDRDVALAREDMGFITWDHPLVHGAMERVLTSSDGNAARAVWRTDVETRFLVVAVFILEAPASTNQATRYLPATPISLCLDEHGDPWRGGAPPVAELTEAPAFDDAEYELVHARLPGLIQAAHAGVDAHARDARDAARRKLQKAEDAEQRRLRVLRQRNADISAAELQHRSELLAQAMNDIDRAPLRLDSIAWIWCRDRHHE